jgi:hypothetical protein
VHFITLHVISARVPFDTRMYIEIFRLRWSSLFLLVILPVIFVPWGYVVNKYIKSE